MHQLLPVAILLGLGCLSGCRKPPTQQLPITPAPASSGSRGVAIQLTQVVKCDDVLAGDTLVLSVEGEQHTVAVALVDCPEEGQPYFEEAKQATADLCRGQDIRCRFGRRNSEGIVQVDVMKPKPLARSLIEAGLGWHDPRQEQDSLVDAHLVAKSKQLGLWSDAAPIPPWFWRAGVRDADQIAEASVELNLPTTASWEQ